MVLRNILEGPIKDILLANPAMVLMSDITSLDASDDVADWVRKGYACAILQDQYAQ